MDPELFQAVNANDISHVRFLLHQGINPNEENDIGLTPIFFAVANGNLPMVNLFIDYGANVNPANDDLSLLSSAVLRNRIDIVTSLLQAGADVNGYIDESSPPLKHAVANGLSDMTDLLLKHGADLFYKDDNGKTLLHIVSQEPVPQNDSDYTQTLKILLDYRDPYGHKLNIDVYDAHNVTPLAEAAFYGNLDLVPILLEYGADPNNIDYEIGIPDHIYDFIQSYDDDIKHAID